MDIFRSFNSPAFQTPRHCVVADIDLEQVEDRIFRAFKLVFGDGNQGMAIQLLKCRANESS